MKFTISVIGFLLLVNVAYAQSGKSLYESKCQRCHNTVDAKETLTGPLLGGITNEVSLKWFSSFTINPMTSLWRNDFRGLCLWEHWKPRVMPKYYDSLTNDQIEEIYKYISQVTKKLNLTQQEMECDSNELLSKTYRNRIAYSIQEKLGLKYSDCSFLDSKIDGVKNVTATIIGDYKKVDFYIIYGCIIELHPIFTNEDNWTYPTFELKGIEWICEENYLLVIGQRNFNEFAAECIKLPNKAPQTINLTLNPRRKIDEVVDNVKLQ